MTPITKQFGLNWFTVVMGFGIVANLAATSPIALPYQIPVGEVLFGVATALLAAAIFLYGRRFVFHFDEVRADFHDAARALFYGAFAMAVNVVGNDFLFIGPHILPHATAVAISQVLWFLGVGIGLFSALVIPYLMFVRHSLTSQDAHATWLIPVVPPIVAAADGVNLLPYFPGEGLRIAMTALDLAMFGMTLFLFLMVSALVYYRLMYHRPLPGNLAPGVWVEIGPIGMAMSTLATLPLATAGFMHGLTPGLHALGMVAAMALWGVGVWWSLIATLYTLMHLSIGDGIAYSLGWWSYVFPLGSFTGGTYALYHLTGFQFFAVAALIQFAALSLCFVVVGAGTLRGVWNGTLIKWRAHHYGNFLPEHREAAPIGYDR